MKLRVLGSAGAEFPHFHPPAFLIDEALLLDAGTIGAVLSEDTPSSDFSSISAFSSNRPGRCCWLQVCSPARYC